MRTLAVVVGLLTVAACSSRPPVVECTGGQTACGSACADLQSDAANCGACGAACGADQSCVKGACYANDCTGADCSAAQVCPSDQCVDKRCVGVVCPQGQACFEGSCRASVCAMVECPMGQVCVNDGCVDAQCYGVLCPAGAVCRLGRCESTSCTDHLVGGGETDVDCGGSCPKCDLGKICGGAVDCKSGNCASGRCAAPTTCNSGTKNGTESDVDCGGGCPGCPVGGVCTGPDDCASGACTANVCVVAPTCSDGAKNGTESDQDCGGGGCMKCGDGKRCNAPTDCTSNQCTAGFCVNPGCSNGSKDGSETDVDCGGPSCAPCANNKACLVHRDCVTMVCNPGTLKCTPPSCTDGLENQTETDIDCGGGTTCAPCAVGKACNVWSDCLSGFCVTKVCTDGYVQDAGVTALTPQGVWVNQLVVGRFNADTCDDVAGTDRYLTFDVNVLLGTASGQLQPPTKITLVDHPAAIDAADLNGDGKLDLVMTTNGNSGGVALGTGFGTFQAPGSFNATIWTQQMRAGPDLTGDGKADVVLGLSNMRGAQIMAGNGNGGLASFLTLTDDAGQGGDGVAVGQLNADNVWDIAFGGNPGNVINVAFGRGDGGYVVPPLRLPTPGRVVFVYAADLNNDQRSDLIATTQLEMATVYLSNGDGTFQPGVDYANVKNDFQAALGDLNGDGNVDFVSATASPNYGVQVRLGTGNGGFVTAVRLSVPRLNTLGIGDVNCDGRPDIVAGTDDSRIWVFVQQ